MRVKKTEEEVRKFSLIRNTVNLLRIICMGWMYNSILAAFMFSFFLAFENLTVICLGVDVFEMFLLEVH